MNNCIYISIPESSSSHGLEFILEACKRTKSIRTNAAIDSIIGIALGNTHGSCLPVALSEDLFPSKSQVICSLDIVDTGFIATLK